MSHIEKILAKIHSVEWTKDPQQANTAQLDGAGDYLRAFARFLREWQVDGSVEMPFANPLRILGVAEQLSPAIISEAEELASQSSNIYDGIYVRLALEWALLCDASHPATLGTEDMFEPLMELVVARVPTGIRKGFWVVDENAFPLLNWQDRYADATD